MLPVSEIPTPVARKIEYVLTDIDDTLTCGGQLSVSSFGAMWQLHNSGIKIIPVTGRPAGWCDCIVRQWPVDAIVGENGAFVLYRAEDTIMEMVNPEIADPSHRERLEVIRRAVFEQVAGARIARDQAYRRYDLAFDFREDPPDLGLDTARTIARICRDFGAEAKISSIHVNTWFGKYDKLGMTRRYFGERLGWTDAEMKSRVAFCGDSPNDSPMFDWFPCACGVANVCELAADMEAEPSFVTQAACGDGFAEFAHTILKKRSKPG